MAQQFEIINGPGKFDLMISLLGDPNQRRAVEFALRSPFSPNGHDNLSVMIEGIQRQDNTGDRWFLIGSIRETFCYNAQDNRYRSTKTLSHHISIKISYNSQFRTGYWEIVEE